MNVDLSELTKWFRDRPSWLQDAARRLLLNGRLDPGDLKELVILCKKEAGINIARAESLAANPIPDDAFTMAELSFALRLESLSEIKGINALAPKKALEFGSEPLTVVYGLNGSGKSGYMRILKHACGARKLGTLHGDVFQDSSSGDKQKSCKVGYSLDGIKKEVVWTPASGVDSELASASLYDTECAHVYVNEENEVAYEPNLLTLFRLLVEACEKVDETLEHEIDGQVSKKPALPVEFQSTVGGKWFSKITRLTSGTEICATCLWGQKGEEELAFLNQRLAEANPAEKAKTLLKTKGRLTEFIEELKTIRHQLSDEVLASLLTAKRDASAKRQVADIDAKKVFENVPLDGVGTETWKLLWEKARLYSEGVAYKEIGFPNVSDQARCVLCQQALTDEAKERLVSFESFIKGSLELEAASAEAAVQSILQGISEIRSGETLDARLDLIGVNDEAIRDMVRTSCDCLTKRRSGFLVALDRSQVELLDGEALIGKLGELAKNLESQAKIFQEDAKSEKRDELKERVKELECQKWLSQQRRSIEGEVERLKMVSLLAEARKLTHTKALSDKKSALADALVTGAFVRRFEEELKSLGASHVQVELIKTKTTKGQVWHQIRLKNSDVPVRAAEVLSEGEFRVVSIAAFLADVEGKGNNAPFVFDDPISSLDQDFEEATASRLVTLSKTRQVIVFTHRLSMLAILEEIVKRQGLELGIISVCREYWGPGEPNDRPFFTQRPDKAINVLLNERLSKARKVFREMGRAEYEPIAKGICSDIRTTVEKVVEFHLLGDVVQRFRRGVQTQGKIKKLAKIKLEDCIFIDDLMTKYSKFEHSQPNESPVLIPPPDEIEGDLKKLKTWYEEFAERSVQNV